MDRFPRQTGETPAQFGFRPARLVVGHQIFTLTTGVQFSSGSLAAESITRSVRSQKQALQKPIEHVGGT